ncbi:phage tail assembly protein [Aeromonas jandaei]|uniref:phage tail assembly protein n=1 Tax=Aeromonas jandaei TaxID=650 RepID=UPI003987F464
MEKELPEYLKFNDDGSADITLSRPADIGGTKVSVLRMREPTVGDQEIAFQMSGSDAAKEITMFANLCGVAPDDVRKFPLRDYGRLQKAYSVFTN